MQPYTFGKIKKYIKENPLLKFEGLEKEDVGNNIKEFFNSFFDYNIKYRTVTLEGVGQCNKGRRRSITDITLISLYYFPRLKLSTIYNNLVRLINEDKIVSALCGDIECRVYRKISNSEKGAFNSALSDEFQVDFLQFEGGDKLKGSNRLWGSDYTIEETLNLIEI